MTAWNLHRLPMADPGDVVNRDRSLFTRRCSVSAGGEQTTWRVLAFGNSTTSTSSLRSGRAVMADAGLVAKAVANAVVGTVVRDPMTLASAGTEHQGPSGSNLVTVLLEVDQ